MQFVEKTFAPRWPPYTLPKGSGAKLLQSTFSKSYASVMSFWLVNIAKMRLAVSIIKKACIFLYYRDILFSNKPRLGAAAQRLISSKRWDRITLTVASLHWSAVGSVIDFSNVIDNTQYLSRLARSKLRCRPFDHLWALWAIVQPRSLAGTAPLMLALFHLCTVLLEKRPEKLRHCKEGFSQQFLHTFGLPKNK